MLQPSQIKLQKIIELKTEKILAQAHIKTTSLFLDKYPWKNPTYENRYNNKGFINMQHGEKISEYNSMSKFGYPTEKNTGKNLVRNFPHPTSKFGL